jgi:site-specific recombinase XerD
LSGTRVQFWDYPVPGKMLIHKGGPPCWFHRLSTFSWIIKRSTLGKKTIKNYRLFLRKFNDQFGDREINEITSEDILTFLVQNSEGQKQGTKRFKFTLLKAFFNFNGI